MPISPVGFTPNSASQELIEIQNVFISTFGATVNLTPTSVNGVLIQELTNMGLQVEAAKTNLYAYLYDPDVAPGVWLDGICKFNNIVRKQAVSSVVTCQITGLSGTVIPVNSQILNTNGDIFYNADPITIVAGTATGTFYSLVPAPIPCLAGTLTRIVQQLSGWDTVTNAADGILGTNQQSDYSLRNTRKYSLALNSTSMFNSIASAIEDTDDIIDYYLLQNTDSAPMTTLGVTVSPKSIYLSVYGGSSGEISKILYDKKSGGCGMDGDTTVLYTNPNYTWATENITWQTAVAKPLQVNITIVNSPSYPANIVTQIQDACVENFNGNVGIDAARMGVEIYASRFYTSLQSLGVLAVTNLTIQTATAGTPASSILLPITDAPTLIPADVIVTVV